MMMIKLLPRIRHMCSRNGRRGKDHLLARQRRRSGAAAPLLTPGIQHFCHQYLFSSSSSLPPSSVTATTYQHHQKKLISAHFDHGFTYFDLPLPRPGVDDVVRFTLGPGMVTRDLVTAVQAELRSAPSQKVEVSPLNGGALDDSQSIEDLSAHDFVLSIGKDLSFVVLRAPFLGGSYGTPMVDGVSELRTIMQKARFTKVSRKMKTYARR